ncbi:MAG: RluA family pseudouridine synthase [Longimicrobiaceae bacterium]
MEPGEVRELVVEESYAAERLDAWLARRLRLSRSRVARLIERGEVRLNGAVPKKRDVPAPGDRVQVILPPPETSPLLPEAIPLEVYYQDEYLLVVNKPAGMVVHPSPGHRSGTLVNALLAAVDDLSRIGGVLRPGIVHRLDRDTSGLLVVAKRDDAHRRLSEELKQRRIRREYLAASWGHLRDDRISVDAPVGRHPRHRERMAVVEGGRRARTRFRVVERWVAAELLRVRLGTGRTHQIRVHLQYLGHPVVGDQLYGEHRERGFSGSGRAWARELARRVPRLFLHAAELGFRHPASGESLRFSAPLPADLREAAEWARKQAA